eukprot:TRINITY_DN3883_c0_g1_i3.p1 TRINITY_DN3883_c0_g1~~TRINITY_DN3883_c0_g1_i3.p1  ORF type:complete len:141 (-),score=4.91 TRINITY_DN3883_c0_g1_i3:134-556(-)
MCIRDSYSAEPIKRTEEEIQEFKNIISEVKVDVEMNQLMKIFQETSSVDIIQGQLIVAYPDIVTINAPSKRETQTLISIFASFKCLQRMMRITGPTFYFFGSVQECHLLFLCDSLSECCRLCDSLQRILTVLNLQGNLAV